MNIRIILMLKNKNMTNEKEILIYKLNDVPHDEGVDLFELTPALSNFGLLLKESAKFYTNDEIDLQIKVKPFKQGSFEVEFIAEVVNKLLISASANQQLDGALKIASVLGLFGGGIKIICWTAGKINQFTKKSDGSIEYYDKNGKILPVTKIEHSFIQNVNVQNYYHNSIVVPMNNINNSGNITINVGGDNIEIDQDVKSFIDTYKKTPVEEDFEIITTPMEAVLSPKRGSYSGEEKQYTFMFGDNKYWPTTIDDKEFTDKIKAGEIRLHYKDRLRVKMNAVQKVSKTDDRILNEYIIEKVLTYTPFNPSEQLKL